jgi:hypothetical protein
MALVYNLALQVAKDRILCVVSVVKIASVESTSLVKASGALVHGPWVEEEVYGYGSPKIETGPAPSSSVPHPANAAGEDTWNLVRTQWPLKTSTPGSSRHAEIPRRTSTEGYFVQSFPSELTVKTSCAQ